MRPFVLLLTAMLSGCAASPDTGPSEADLAAVRQVTMSGRILTWQELRVHPSLMQRACAVSTLVNEGGEVIGYCSGGRQCRTNDWRPVESACDGASQYRAAPAVVPPAIPASLPAYDLARAR